MAKPPPEDFPGVVSKSDFTKIVSLCHCSGDDRKAQPEDIISQTQDDNGLIFGPNASPKTLIVTIRESRFT